MDFIEPAAALPRPAARPVVGEWFLKGFADAYGAHWAVTPWGPAGEQYTRGYALGLEAVRREFFEALSRIPLQQTAASEASCFA